ncbi:spondin-2a [Lepisosteus oculatus]|uniref:spondin-2a n=1 Tax=Lepisosteus oculatus TaxID=7918 RepID=UPI0035F52F0A
MMSPEILSPGWLQRLLAAALMQMALWAGNVRSSADRPATCLERGPASYILVFTGQWSPQTFPKQYPLYRPPAQWSKLIAVSHGRHYRLWQEGAPASPGLCSFAELGVTAPLLKEAKEARRSRRGVGALYRTPGLATGIGHSSTELLLHPRHPRLSLLVKIIPSPDWFVGVDSLDLCEGGQWKQDVTLNLYPYDAGSDSGFTFSSPNFPTDPPENITRITSQNPSHPANSFYYPRLAELPPLAAIRLLRQSRAPSRHTPLSNHIPPQPDTPHFSETPLDCEVSLWSSWGLCLGPCGGGVRHRTRYILLKPANSGSPCPELEEQSACTPDNCL